jgi:hypothetical protein
LQDDSGAAAILLADFAAAALLPLTDKIAGEETANANMPSKARRYGNGCRRLTHAAQAREIALGKSPVSSRTKRSKEKSQESLGIPGKMNREASRLGDVRIRRPSSREIVPETGAATTSRRGEI